MAATLAITTYLSGLVSSAAIPKRTRYNDLRRRVTADSQQREWHGSLAMAGIHILRCGPAHAPDHPHWGRIV
jgi:hypothetical protein